MRHLALAALAACASGQRGETAQLVHVEPRPPVHAAHGGTIVQVAVTDDGRAAVSQDSLGGTRVWPALDGSIEPIAIAVPAARELAIVHDESGYAIAAIDDAGTLAVIDVTASGQTYARTQPATDVVELAAIDDGIVALRADQTVVRCDVHGRVTGRLAAPPGQRITRVIARHGRVLALVRGKQLRGQWLDLVHFTWGAQTSALPSDAADAALSPDGETLAVAANAGVKLVTLATGRVRAPKLCVPTIAPIGFVDASTIACRSDQLEWYGFDGKPAPQPGPLQSSEEIVAVGDGVAVTANQHDLALRTATGAHYLGYQFGAIALARATSTGILVTGADGAQVEVDRELASWRGIAMPHGADAVVLALDAHRVLVSTVAAFGDHLAVLDLETGHLGPEITGQLHPLTLSYDPASQLVAGIDDEGAVVRRFDPATGTLGEATYLIKDATQVALLDPALADGDVVAVLRSRDHMNEAATFAASDLRPGVRITPRRTFMTFDPVFAIDRAGRVFTQDGDDLVIDVGNTQGLAARLGAIAEVLQVAPSPDGKLVTVLTDHALSLFDAAGHRRWEISVEGGRHVVWSDGAPYLQLPSAIIRIDLATGELAMRSCGWGLALTDEPPHEEPEQPSVCDAP